MGRWIASDSRRVLGASSFDGDMRTALWICEISAWRGEVVARPKRVAVLQLNCCWGRNYPKVSYFRIQRLGWVKLAFYGLLTPLWNRCSRKRVDVEVYRRTRRDITLLWDMATAIESLVVEIGCAIEKVMITEIRATFKVSWLLVDIGSKRMELPPLLWLDRRPCWQVESIQEFEASKNIFHEND